MVDDEKPFEQISFTDLVLHTLLDKFEFSAHSFVNLNGPYFWNGIGIDFNSPMPEEDVLQHARSVGANKVYAAHTHPMSNDDSLKFIGAKVDPREEVAFGHKQLPLGNKPSVGDIKFLSQINRGFAAANIKIIGVVFSASGLWEFDIPDASNFDTKKFSRAYDTFYADSDTFVKTYNSLNPDNGGYFINNWTARDKFPSYYMELQKPKMHQTPYTTQITKIKTGTRTTPAYDEEVLATVNFFSDYGITLAFHPYTEFDIDPQALMRSTLARWTDRFTKA